MLATNHRPGRGGRLAMSKDTQLDGGGEGVDGVFEFSDGGRYRGEWCQEGGAEGYGVCTGPGTNGQFAGKWERGEQRSGVFTWDSGHRYAGTWAQGMRDGVGEEIHTDGSQYSGDFTCNFRGVYGILKHPNGALYSGMWSQGLQNGEGMEVYVDEGVYKGEYQSGVRHGHGSRTSAAYEAYEKSIKAKQLKNDSSDSKRYSLSPQPRSFVADQQRRFERTATWSSVTPPALRAEGLDAIMVSPDAQIYEGQWKEDMRNGYGVLKIPKRYSYFGEWRNNSRTGYGVMVYNDGHREEGQWEAGRLVFPLKRKKLSLKHYQLETKVKQAHTQAIQSADLARTRAKVAESKASAASVRSIAAQKAAAEAKENGRKARLKASEVEGRRIAQESSKLKSPMGEMLDDRLFAPLAKPTHDSSLPQTMMKTLLQLPRQSVHSSPSFEDLAEVNQCHLSGKSPSHLSGSSSDSLSSGADEEPSIEKDEAQHQRLPRRRKVHKGSLQVQGPKNYALRNVQHASLRPTTSDPVMTSSSRSVVSIQVTKPSNDLEALSLDSATLGNLSRGQDDVDDDAAVARPSAVNSEAQVRRRKRPILLDMHKDIKFDESPKESDQCLVDQSTGELVTRAEDVAVEGKLESRTKGVTGDLAPSNPNMEMLNQLANWNRVFTFINFILLIFLLILISAVLFFMSYTAQLTNSQNPAGLMTRIA